MNNWIKLRNMRLIQYEYEIRRFDNDEDRIIQDRLKQKNWNEIRTNDSWAIF
jgi:hypothetical protein